MHFINIIKYNSCVSRRVQNKVQHTVPLSLLFSINLRIWTCSSSTTTYTHTHTHTHGFSWVSKWQICWCTSSDVVCVTYPQSSFSVCDSRARTLAVSASPRPSPRVCPSHLCPAHASGETAENYSSVASTRAQFRLMFDWRDHFRLQLLWRLCV